MSRVITFNNVASDSLGIVNVGDAQVVFAGGQETYRAPQTNVNKVSIPGRNGTLIRFEDSFANIELPYHFVIMRNFKTVANAVIAWLKAPTTYAVLADSEHTDYYRMAMVHGELEFEPAIGLDAGVVTAEFDCMPQKFLYSGDTWLTPASGASTLTVTNPTSFASKPLIRVYGSGDASITVGNQTIAIDDLDGYIDIDSDIMDCYKGSLNLNSKVTLGANGFPTLPSGSTTIDFSDAHVTSVEVKGRWWTL